MKQTFYALCGIILLFLGACGIKEWTMPQWDVTLRIPLINEKYYVMDLADGENLIIDENNVLVMQGSGSMSTPQFGALLYHSAIDTNPIPLTANIDVTLDFLLKTRSISLDWSMAYWNQAHLRPCLPMLLPRYPTSVSSLMTSIYPITPPWRSSIRPKVSG